jgi:hypothetical protein
MRLMSHAWYTFSATASRSAPLADLLVGNRVTANAVAWSVSSIVFLLGKDLVRAVLLEVWKEKAQEYIRRSLRGDPLVEPL